MIPHKKPIDDWSSALPTETSEGFLRRAGRALEVVARFVGAALFGGILAVIAQYLFFVGALAWLNLVVWAIIAISVGVILRTWAMTISVCAVIGFSIVFTYSIAGYHANAPLLTAIPLFAVLAIVGAFGMSAGGAVGHLLRQLGSGTTSAPRRVLLAKGDKGREIQK